MSFMSRNKKLGPLLLCVFLIAYGVAAFVPIPYAGYIVGGLAIAAGVLLLIDR